MQNATLGAASPEQARVNVQPDVTPAAGVLHAHFSLVMFCSWSVSYSGMLCLFLSLEVRVSRRILNT